ncbi:MAG: DNA mismatch repair endonuclease MutL, partial [candidate division Zixibacteria bacterium]|nr:DNA mismatch repair endonuclease MutL [candidate division Zixibacteria bacterium]
TDNGCGIRSDQVRLAFSRHATSKIHTLDELFAVFSFGFRGEALPSIASVSHLALTTRHFTETEGTFIAYEGGKEIEMRPVAAPVGTKVEVSHLFFNTPARRKFLKAETTESRQIVRVAERMALSRPSATISLTLNDRETFRLPANQPIAERMAALFGVRSDSIVEYDVELGGVSFMVYLAHPDQARNDRSRICLFINGRAVTSSSIIHAVTAGYGELMTKGRYPLAAVYLTIDPTNLDVNVHPTKAEVRLSEESAIHDNLYRIVNKALRDWKLVGGGGADGSRPTMPGNQRPGEVGRPDFRPSGPAQPGGSAQRSFFTGGVSAHRPTEFARSSPPVCFDLAAACETQGLAAKPEEQLPAAGEMASAEQIEFLGWAGRTYLIMTIAGELYIVDQHAAHERILYEEALRQVESGGAAGQKLLFPETVELTAEEYLLFEECHSVLEKLGFDIGPFGRNSVIVQGLPTTLGEQNPQTGVKKILDDIAALNKAGGELIKSVAQSLACRAAVMAGQKLSGEEVKGLMRRLFEANNPYCCPHGRPTFIKISREELDGRFGRK